MKLIFGLSAGLLTLVGIAVTIANLPVFTGCDFYADCVDPQTDREVPAENVISAPLDDGQRDGPDQ